MTQQGGLGRGLASLIPQKNIKKEEQEKKQINKTDEDQSYLSYKTKGQSKVKKKISPSIKEGSGAKKYNSSVIGKTVKSGKSKGVNNASSQEGVKNTKFQEGVENVGIEMIVPNPHQPRVRFNESKLAELADSIKEHGIIQPLIVTSIKDGDYELIAGERRLEASKIAGLEQVPVIVKDVDDQKKAEWALIENVQRHDLNPMEEARAYKKMQNKFSMTQEDIAIRVGKSRSTIANSLRLLNLPIEIQRALMNEKITEGHAKTILAINNPEKQRALYELILKENLNVRQTESKVRDALGGGARRKTTNFDPELHSMQERLAQSLGTKVEIKKSSKGGKIVIDFYSEEEFDSLLSNLTSQDD